jgi:hypothetical protein
LLPLTPQVSQVGNPARVEWEAVTLPLDHAQDAVPVPTGLTVVGFADCRREKAALGTDDPSLLTASVIVFVSVASR